MINIVLYEPEIPQNTGNIMRTCMAFQMRLHLIEPLGFIMDDAHLKRAGLDYRKNVVYRIHPSWDDFLRENSGDFYFVTRYGEKAPSSFDYTAAKDDIYLVFGKESTGIPKEILAAHLDRCMRIPMVPEARSLNLSNCVAIVSYVVLEQLGFPHLSGREMLKGADFLKKYARR